MHGLAQAFFFSSKSQKSFLGKEEFPLRSGNAIPRAVSAALVLFGELGTESNMTRKFPELREAYGNCQTKRAGAARYDSWYWIRRRKEVPNVLK